jgi:hypothetical protein
VSDKIDALAGTDADARRAELLAYLQSRQEFAAAGTNADGSLWARFTDGRLFLILANDDDRAAPVLRAASSALPLSPIPTAAARPVGSTPSRPAGVAAMGPPAELPLSTTARVLGGGEPDDSPFMLNFIPKLAGMLQAGGYQVVSGKGTIEALQQVTGGDGVFYFGGHGGEGSNGAGESVYGVTTATPLSARNDSIFKALWLDSSLVYTARLDPGLRPPFSRCPRPCTGYYAFTAKFVKKHLGQFAAGSVVYLSACSSNNAEMRQAFLDKGAGVFFGWDAPFRGDVDANASLFLFDRLMGLNDPTVFPVSPKQRAFDYVSVYNDMASASRQLTTYQGATLHYQPGNTESGLLAPSIKYLMYDELTRVLVLTGKFGSDPRQSPGGGEVSINSRSSGQLQIQSWSPEEIRVLLPASGASAAGDVVVWNRGRRSTARRLSEWSLTGPAPAPIAASRSTGWMFNLQFLPGDGTLKWEGGVRLHIRVDLGSYREQSGEDPRYRVVPFQIGADSYGELVGSGTSADGQTSWTGSPAITTRLADPSAQDVVDGVGEIDPETHMMRLALYISVPVGLLAVTPDGSVTLPAVWGSNDGPLNAQLPLPSLYLPLNSTYGIIGDQRRQAPTDPSSYLFWSDLTPDYSPSDTMPR